jgi:hypothetical protein
MRGIDRYFERYYAKGPRRRPVRVEFCEPDVLDVFDEWRRSVGISSGAEISSGAGDLSGAGDSCGADPLGPRAVTAGGSLPAHLERVIARLTTLRVRSVIDAVDASAVQTRPVRGQNAATPVRSCWTA